MNSSQYIAGECNIGRTEINLRKRLGWVGLALTIVFWVLLITLHARRWWFFLVIVPSTVCAVGFFQAMFHFCVAFGLGGVSNIGSEIGKTTPVVQAESRSKDRKRAMKILGYSLLVGLSVATIAFMSAQVL